MHDEEGDQLDRILARKARTLALIGIPAAYLGTLLYYPQYWAVGMALIFVIASGLFTTKILLAFEKPWAAFGLAPVFGGAWLGFLWLLSKLFG